MKKTKTPHIDPVKENKRLLEEIKDLSRAKEINEVLFRISNSVNTSSDLNELYSSIHRSLGKIVNVTSFYIAMYDKETNRIFFPYSNDEDSGLIEPDELDKVLKKIFLIKIPSLQL